MLTPYEKKILIEGICLYAWWKDGIQYVGNGGRTLAQAIEDIASNRDEPFVNLPSKIEIRDSIGVLDTYTKITNSHKPPIQVTNAIIVLKSLLL